MLGRRVFEVVDPAAADREEGRRLEAEERAAARSTYLHLHDNGDGTHSGRFKISDLHAAMLRKALHAIVAPGRRTDAGPPACVGDAGTSERDVRAADLPGSAGPAACPWMRRARGRTASTCRGPSGSGRRCAGCSNGSRPTGSPTPVASAPPWWC